MTGVLAAPIDTESVPAAISVLRDQLTTGTTSVVAQVEASLSAIRERNPGIGAFVSVAGPDALRAAEHADRRIRGLGDRAFARQPLLGATVSVKDLIQTSDFRTRRGSLVPNRRAQVDAPAVARLRAAGAIVIGKTTTSEHGWSASTVSRVAPATRNPWARTRTSGGSSGGAAASVAAGMCTVGLGTDGAGSVRIPASFCGVVGFKPSFGRIPYVPSGADELAHVGPLARSVGDVRELMAILAGPDPRDPDSVVSAPAHTSANVPLRIGWLEFPGTSSAVRTVSARTATILAAAGHRIECIEPPFPDPYPALVDLIAAAEAAGSDPADDALCDRGRRAVLRHGRSLSGVDVARAREARQALRITLAEVMQRYDLLAMATVPIEPFAVDAIAPEWAADPRTLQWLAWTPATYPFNLTGQPAISVPVGRTELGLPVGVQLVGAVGADDLVLAAAHQVEAGTEPLPLPTK